MGWEPGPGNEPISPDATGSTIGSLDRDKVRGLAGEVEKRRPGPYCQPMTW